MGGIKETAIYKLELDTSSLVKDFESAIAAMKKAGVNGKITESLTNELDKLKRKSDELQSIGRFGVEGSKGIQSFDAKVKRLYESYNILGDKIKNTSKNAKNFSSPGIEKLKSEIDELQKKLVTSFDGIQKKLKEIGVGADITNELGKTIKSQEELNKKLDEEKKKREANLAVAQQEAGKAKANAASAVVAKGKNNLTDANFTGGSKGDRAAAASLINEEINKLVLQGKNFDAIWSSIQEKVKGLGPVFNGDIQVQEKIRQKLLEVEKEYQKTAEAKKLAAAQSSVDAMGGVGGSTKISGVTDDAGKTAFEGATKAAEQLRIKEAEVKQLKEELAKAQAQLRQHTDNLNDSVRQSSANWSTNAQTINETAQSSEKLKGEINAVIGQITRMFSLTAIFASIRNAIRQTITDLTNLDKSFASIAMVTDKTLGGMWASYGDYNKMAQELGQTTDSVIKASALFYQQGLDEAEALSLTADTMKLATLAETDYETATKEMTAAIRGFKMEMSDGMHVTDVYSNLAASAAASVDEISQAMQRTASIANSAGMSFENTSAFLTQMIETTQESAENIGTSMKTIIARFTELKENVAGTADSEFDDLDYNKVDKALKSVGVSLKDTQGQFRNLDEVFLELSKKWDTLDRNTQRYVATIAAGSRQQSRFIAMMDNYERTAELMDIAAESEGKADEQFAKYADTVEYKTNQMKAKWEEFRTSLINSDTFKGILDGINALMNRINNIKIDGLFNKAKLAGLIPLAIWAGKTFVSNFLKGMKNFGSSFSQIFQKISKNINKSLVGQNKLKIKVEVDEAAMNTAVAKVRQLAQDIDPDGDKQLLLKVATLVDPTAITDMNSFKMAIQDLQLGEQQLNTILSQLQATENGNEQELAELITKLREYSQATRDANNATNNFNNSSVELKKKQAAISQGMSIVSSSVGILVSTLMAGGSATDAFKAALISITMQAIPIVLTGIGNIVAAIVTGAATAEISIAAATMGISLLIAAIAAAVAALGWWISSDISARKDAASSAKQLTAAQEEYNDALAKEQEHKENIENLSEEKDTIEEMVEEYNQLSQKVIKSSDEESRMVELKEEILSKYPEIISYEDKETGILHIQNDLIDEKLNKLDEQIEKEKRLSLYEQAKQSTARQEIDKQESIQMLNKSLGIDIDANYKGFNLAEGEKTNSLLMAALNGRDVSGVNLDNMKESYYYDSDGRQRYRVEDKEGKFLYGGQGVHQQDAFLGDNNYSLSELRNFYDKSLGGIDKSGEKVDFDELGNDVKQEILTLYVDALDAQGLQTEEIAEVWKKGATDFSETVKEVKDKLSNYLENYEYFQEYYANDSQYADENELQKNIRASMSAAAASEENAFVFSDMENLEYNGAHVYDDLDKINNQLGIEDTTELDKIKGEYDDVFEAIGQDHIGLSNSYAAAVQDIIDETDLTKERAEEILEEIGYGKDTYSDTSDKELQKAMAKAYFTQANQKRLEEKGLEITAAADEAVKIVGELQAEGADLTAEEYKNKLDQALNIEGLDENTANVIKEGLDWDQGDIDNLQEKLSSIYSDPSLYDGLSVGVLQALENANEGLIEQAGSETLGNEFQKSLTKTLQSANIDSKNWAQILQIDWSQATNPENFEEFKEKTIMEMKNAGILGAESLFDQLSSEAKEFGALNISIDTDEELEAFLEDLDEAKDKIESLGQSLTASFKDIIESGEISFDTFNSLADSMSELGLNVYDYVNIDNAGKITATEKGLKGLYEAQLEAQRQKIKNTYEENKLKIDELNATNTILKTQMDQIDATGTINLITQDEVTKQIELYRATHAIVNELRELQGLDQLTEVNLSNENLKDNEGAIDAAKKSLQTQIDINTEKIKNYKETNNTLKENLDNFDDYSRAAIRNYTTNNNELLKSTEEQTQATEGLTNAQEKLNEAIKEYNELLYGSDNRKSGLDLLYNYEQAITSFNNEITRSKELLEDSSSYDEATGNLKRYLTATHNLIAEEKAKQSVMQAGMNNIESQMLGGTSYTNAETGEVINVDFSQYVKKDERTGKYILDQTLLDRAKFNDSYKDLLENYVSDYNKYVDDSLSIEDDLRKKEKELEEQRLNARKDYVAAEEKIKEVLKAEYQEEVDDLKNKYDSMKEADDDYVNALQEAIQKQRDLRDQENAWEDLAEKEKRLSLMQRDTSGGNQVETQQLEEEIQEDRQSLLDEAIDKVIEGLSELHESQSELRDTEIELKEALLDNEGYWNTLSESVVASWENAEQATVWYTEHAVDLIDQTYAAQQVAIAEFNDVFNKSLQERAFQEQDIASTTGNVVQDTMTVTGEEVQRITQETGEALVKEAGRAMDETTQAFLSDLEKAELEIADAKKALQEAINKLNEYAQAAKNAEDARNQFEGEKITMSDGPLQSSIARSEQEKGIANNLRSANSSLSDYSNTDTDILKNAVIGMQFSGGNRVKLDDDIMKDKLDDIKNLGLFVASASTDLANKNKSYRIFRSAEEIDEWIKNGERDKFKDGTYNRNIRAYATGGLVNYTGPAWVDGTPAKPESFLSAEDTERIGNAARILANIPWLDRETDSSSVITNNAGDVNVEINLNVDHISSDVDIDEMLERVKDEIVEVARPIGTNTILQQQL